MMAQPAPAGHDLVRHPWRKVYIKNIAIGSQTGADQAAIYVSIASQGSTRKNRRLLGL
jgi:hypothetical protein